MILRRRCYCQRRFRIIQTIQSTRSVFDSTKSEAVLSQLKFQPNSFDFPLRNADNIPVKVPAVHKTVGFELPAFLDNLSRSITNWKISDPVSNKQIGQAVNEPSELDRRVDLPPSARTVVPMYARIGGKYKRPAFKRLRIKRRHFKKARRKNRHKVFNCDRSLFLSACV